MRTAEDVEIEVDGKPVRFQLTQLPGLRAGTLLVRIGKIVGPALTKATALTDAKSGGPNMGALVDAVGELSDYLKPEDFESITLQLLEGCSYWNSDEDLIDLDRKGLDQMFRGNIDALFKLIGAALKANYGNFFKGAGLKKIIAPSPSKT